MPLKTSSRLRALAGLATLMVVLQGCSSVSEYTDAINPFAEREKILPGDRQPVFADADPLASAAGKAASIGSATGGQNWPQAGGPENNDAGNIAVSVSGQRVWRASIGSSGGGLTASGLRAAARPVSDGGRIFVYKPSGEVMAFTTGGARAWTRDLRPEGEDDVASGGGVAVANGRVFAATGYRKFAALDAGSGQVLWTIDLSTPARGAPAVGNGYVFVVTQNNEVYAIKQEDGSVVWTYSGIEESAGLLSASAPAVVGGTVVVPFSSGEIMAIDIKKGEPIWAEGVARAFRTLALSTLADVSASPVVAGGTVFATGVAGRTIAASLKTGQIEWQQDIGSVHTPVVSGSAVFMVTLDDRMVALDRKTGQPLWRADLPQLENKKKRRNWAGPVLANGTLVAFSNDGRIALVDATSGNVQSVRDVQTNVFVTPIVAGGRVIVLEGDNGLAAFN
ncbi:PQQ-binding-like beta-propeller repeat protein [Microvirga tunisiensis]|uniref:PQQ-binding-like beta-propeller repeat protein n=1 Tax=Pannonibacter tanglangensis TaxID=2750084 RepID=A0A7X5J8B6_9HYPH|nr:PQQ-binding-like beta-propeller repeat protein [Pannonibacter sp. XCT-53]NBN77712.1 PQQ-binding-like beta-propeller repeat protein [Pannonibacter sp. XCT-53]